MPPTTVRNGGTPLTIRNSGNEVWLYDDANRETIRAPGEDDDGHGGMPPRFHESTAQGLIVGYSLYQDDDVQVTVIIGERLTEKELSAARWLEPQTAFLKLPSGRLCVESNDASRVGPDDPTEQGAVVDVPPGDYLLTLYRVDHEALDREGTEWTGSQEIVVLTPGGTPDDAATDFLPFQERRDTGWVGKYAIKGKEAHALVWFGDYWDTFVLNLDSAALAKLGVKPGMYLSVRVPDTGHTLVTVFAESWTDGKKLPLPDGIATDEYGFAAIAHMQEWNGAEALFCRRDLTRTVVEDAHKTMWLPAMVEVLDAKPLVVKPTARGFTPTNFRDARFYDPSFLGLILSDVLPGVGDLDELLLPDAVDRLDDVHKALGFAPVADVAWTEKAGRETFESSARLYGGVPNCLGAVTGSDSSIDVLFLSELEDGQWILTGLADDIETRINNAAARRPEGLKIEVQTLDEHLEAMFEKHRESMAQAAAPLVPVQPGADGAEAAFRRFLVAAFG